MLEELSKTVKAQLYERVSSPLLGSFLIAWCGWNYKFVLVLISSMEAEKKLAYINANLYPSIWDRVLEGFTYPLVTSLVLIFAYPWPARWIFSYSRKQQLKLKKLQYEIDEDTPLNMEDARELRRSNSKIVEDFEKEISLQKSQIERQKEQLEIARESLKNQGSEKEHIAELLSQLSAYEQRTAALQDRLKREEDNAAEVVKALNALRSKRSEYDETERVRRATVLGSAFSTASKHHAESRKILKGD